MDIQTTDLLRNPDWLVHRYDEAAEAFHFVPLSREKRRGIAFLDDEYISADVERRIVPLRSIPQAIAPAAPIHFIFHSGFCCSTLLTRALDQAGLATSLSEPTILRDLVGIRQRGMQVENFASIFAPSLSLLARPFENGEAVVAKPSCTVNGLATTLLTALPECRALYLYAPIRVFLGSVVRKGITGRTWGRELFQVLQSSNRIDLGFSERQLFGQTDLQIAGLAWLMQNMLVQALLEGDDGDRVRTLDSETFLARPAEALHGVARHYALSLDQDAAARIAQSDIFQTHSKFGGEFDVDNREQERVTEEAHADEIEKVAIWVETIADMLKAPMSMGSPLLG